MADWFDSHCHLDTEADEVLARARGASVVGLVTVGTDLEHSRVAIAVANAHPDVWATVGVHPHEARHGLDGIAELLNEGRVVAFGRRVSISTTTIHRGTLRLLCSLLRSSWLTGRTCR